jgi:predicted nucleotidyltransferase
MMQVLDILNKETTEELKRNKKIMAVLLFGSYISRPEQAHDVDLAIAGELTEKDGLELFAQLQSNFNKELDWVIFNNTTNDILAFEIIKNNKILYVADPDYLAGLFSLMIRKHEDEKKVRDRYKKRGGINKK